MIRPIQNSILTATSKEIIKANHSWKLEISTNAEKSRKKQKMLKPDVMPLTNDIKKVCAQVIKLELNIAQRFQHEKSYVIYEELCKITIAHITISLIEEEWVK